jgi:hypothetical protein
MHVGNAYTAMGGTRKLNRINEALRWSKEKATTKTLLYNSLLNLELT